MSQAGGPCTCGMCNGTLRYGFLPSEGFNILYCSDCKIEVKPIPKKIVINNPGGDMNSNNPVKVELNQIESSTTLIIAASKLILAVKDGHSLTGAMSRYTDVITEMFHLQKDSGAEL